MKKLLSLGLTLLALSSYGQQDSLGMNKVGHFPYVPGINDIWGYADNNGNEYALVGVNTGFSIVDITNPSTPVEKHFISGASTIWRDVKTWSHYAYVSQDGVFPGNSDGIVIVDLNTIDSTTISYTQFYPTVTLDTVTYSFVKAHNLYIDENGVLYVFGSNIGKGGALMFDVSTNPTNPIYLGAYDDSYYHDGVARGDTLWGAAINKGRFEVVNVSNKSNPSLMATQGTPKNFTHNIWFSDDNQTVFTTDERKNAPVTAYDVSDLTNITELDRIQTGIYDPTQVIPHNTHVIGNFLVTSYYTSGVQIVDASKPDILVETAYYDTSPLVGDGYDGAWGAYPWLPSGLILVTDRQEGLFILSSTYPRACYFTAFIKDSVTSNPIVNADIEMLNTNIIGTSNIFGNFRDGQADTGVFQVVVSKAGYYNDTITVNMQQGVTVAETVALIPLGFSVSELESKKLFSIYPNPSTDMINIEVPGTGNSELQLDIFDIRGALILSQKLSMAGSKASIEHDLPEGLYLIQLSNQGQNLGSQRILVND